MSALDQAWDAYKARANEVPLLQAAQSCGATLKRVGGGEHIGPCPCCGGRDRFGVNETKQKWICRGAGGGGDPIGLVRHCMGMDFKQACEFLTGEAPPSGRTEYSEKDRAEWARRKAQAEERDRLRREEEAKDAEDRKENAIRIWGQAQPISGTIAERYLFNRIRLLDTKGPLPDVLRFHPACYFAEERRRFPSLVARVDDASGEQVGIWRIALDDEGRNVFDADGEKIKRGLGPCGGGAIRLHKPIDGVIAVCEGIETAFGVHMMTGKPIWSCRTANGLSGFDIPWEISRLDIYPDGDRWKWQSDKGKWLDPTGRREALKLAEKAIAQGVEVTMANEPKPGRDFLDAWETIAKSEVAA